MTVTPATPAGGVGATVLGSPPGRGGVDVTSVGDPVGGSLGDPVGEPDGEPVGEPVSVVVPEVDDPAPLPVLEQATSVIGATTRSATRADRSGRDVGTIAPGCRGRDHQCGRTGPVGWSGLGHVDEPRVVALERDGDVGGRAVAVLGEDEVGLARARRLPLVGVLAVQQDHHVGILLDAARFA